MKNSVVVLTIFAVFFFIPLPSTVEVTGEVVNCHHNYVAREHHYGADVWVTRKGAIRAGQGELGIVERRVLRVDRGDLVLQRFDFAHHHDRLQLTSYWFQHRQELAIPSCCDEPRSTQRDSLTVHNVTRLIESQLG